MDRRLAATTLGLGLLALSAACAHGPSKKEKENAEIHYNLGTEALRAGRAQEALKEYDEALKEFDAALQNMLYKEPWVARCNKGQALWRMGRRDEGLAEFRSCLNQSPRFCQGHRELGRLWLAEGKAPEAVEEFTQYARSCERTPDAWYQLGLAHLRAGDADKAREALDRCLGVGAEGSLAEDCRRARETLR